MPQCHVCGAEERPHDRFHEDRSALGRSRRLCPSCRAHRHVKAARSLGPKVAAAFGGGLIAVGVGRAAGSVEVEALGWAVLNFGLMLVLIAALSMPHELAHAGVARALGMHVYRIRIGTGRLLWKSNIGGIHLRVHAVPWSGGLTMYAPSSTRGVRLRRALVAIVGPALHGALLIPIVLFGTGDPARLLSGVHVVLDFAVANLFLLVVNLVPWRAPVVDGIFESDGLVLIKAPFLRGRELETFLMARHVTEAALLSEEGRFEEASQRAQEALSAFPDSLAARQNVGMMLALAGRCGEAREAFRQALNLPDVPRDTQAILRNNVAWASLMLDELEEADAESARAVEELGWLRPLQGTRGAVLVARGQLKPGLDLLREALARSEQLHPMARATYEGATALGLARSGAMADAQTHLDRAREAFPTCPLLPRVERLLTGSSDGVGDGQPATPDATPATRGPERTGS